jgi:NADH-quinone oxidoreductase subunit M
MFEKVFLGPVKHVENANLKDLSFRETLVLAPIIALIFAIGLFPQPVFDLIQPSVDGLIQVFQSTLLVLH